MPSPDTLHAVADLGVGAPGPLTAEQIDAVQAYTDPATAGYLLAKLITGLPDEMLTLISGDQIIDKAILGCPVPEPARPILRAIYDKHEPVLDLLCLGNARSG